MITQFLSLAILAQTLVSADGTEWNYIASGRDKDGAKFNVFARRVDNAAYPELEIKFGHSPRIRAEHECKRGLYRLKGEEKWAKPTGSVGAKLVKFACKR